ncbi:unnamed protein product [Rotaria sp. Silwood1]|nr:unnamed protein product [Rotaria sp. Silwood1]
MSSNSVSSEDNVSPPRGAKKKMTWKELVKEQADKDNLKGATCAVYSENGDDTVNKETQCICGRLARQHSFIGQPKTKFRNAQRWIPQLAIEVDVTHYGQLENGARFIRCDTENDTFKTLVEIIVKDGATCAVYSENGDDTVNKETKCICGRLASQHSFIGQPKTKFRNAQRWIPQLAVEVDVTHDGQLENGARFIRCDTENDTFKTLVEIIVKDVSTEPKLLVSCYGGAGYFTMTDDLEREFMSGIGQVAATKDVWILTTGLNSGVSGLIAEGVHRNILLSEDIWKPIALESQSTTSQDSVPSLDENDTKALDKYHTHFLLLDAWLEFDPSNKVNQL